MSKAPKTSDEVKEVNDEYGRLPVDRGWAWVILFAVWFQSFLIVGYYKAFGILFIEMQNKYSASSSLTSLVSTFLNIAYSISSLLITTVGIQVLSTRTSCMLGSFLTCLSLVIAAYTTSIEGLVVSVGFMMGIGFGMVFTPSLVILSQYFDKRHGIANCIATAGGSAGSLAFPQLTRYLLDTYGLSGALLLLGGVMLNGAVAAALMTPVEFYANNNNKFKITVESVNQIPPTEIHMVDVKDPRFANGVTHSVDDVRKLKDLKGIVYEWKDARNEIPCSSSSVLEDGQSGDFSSVTKSRHMQPGSFTEGLLQKELHTEVTSPLVQRALFKHRRNRTTTETSNASVSKTFKSSLSSLGKFASSEFAVSSMLDVRSIHSDRGSRLSVNNKMSTTEVNANEKHCFHCFSKFIDCSIIKRCTFLLFLPFGGLIALASSVIMTYIPPHGKDLQLSDATVSVILSIIGAVDFFSLIIWGIIADRTSIKPNILIAGVTITLGFVTQFMSFMTSEVLFIVYCVIYGLLGRVYFSMYPVMLVYVLGHEHLRNALAVTALIHAGSIASALPVVGFLRDVSGSYIPGFHFLGTAFLLGGFGLLLLPLGARCDVWREARAKRRETTEA